MSESMLTRPTSFRVGHGAGPSGSMYWYLRKSRDCMVVLRKVTDESGITADAMADSKENIGFFSGSCQSFIQRAAGSWGRGRAHHESTSARLCCHHHASTRCRDKCLAERARTTGRVDFSGILKHARLWVVPRVRCALCGVLTNLLKCESRLATSPCILAGSMAWELASTSSRRHRHSPRNLGRHASPGIGRTAPRSAS